MPTSLIFGGSGFIGCHLARFLHEQGHTVIIADIAKPKLKLPKEITLHKCDVRNPINLDKLPNIDRVYNLAAIHQTPGHPDHEYFETNVSGAENITTFCTEHNVHTLVFTSSISVYGPSEDGKTEESPCEPKSAYGKSKLEAEEIHTAWQKLNMNRKLIITRPGVIFGEGENGNFTRLAHALKQGIFFYAGRKDTIKGCCYVKELLNALEFAVELNKPTYLFNMAYPKAYTIEDICGAFAAFPDVKPPRGTLPMWLLNVVAYSAVLFQLFGFFEDIKKERINKLTRSTHTIPKQLQEDGYNFSTSLETALKDWSYQADGFA